MQTVNPDGSVTFTAVPNTGYTVNAWSVNGTVVQYGYTTLTLGNITTDYTILVTFTRLTYTVTPTAGANGAISPNSVQTVNPGASLTFTATANTGYLAYTWSVDGTVAQTGGTSFTLADITANHTVLVAFTPSTDTVTPTAGANGTISPSSVQTVSSGKSLTFTATPNTGFTVNSWSVDGTGVQTGGTSFTLADITANHTVLVTFSPISYTITPTAGANGAISPSTAQKVNSGGSLTLTATPNTGYLVNSCSVDGTAAQSGGTSFTLANITANHAVTVTFMAATVSAVSLTALPAAPQPVNTPITLTAVATGNGGQVQYLFRVGYSDNAGWHWTNLTTSYTTTASCTWTPLSPGTFTLVVWARIIGHTANYDQYQSLIYQIITPLTAVALNSQHAAAGETLIKLTATPTGGGGQVTYLFRVGTGMPRAGTGRISRQVMRPPPLAAGHRSPPAPIRWWCGHASSGIPPTMTNMLPSSTR